MEQGKLQKTDLFWFVTHNLNFLCTFRQAIIGLPADFLRLLPHNVQESVDREAAMALQQQIGAFNPIALAVSIQP